MHKVTCKECGSTNLSFYEEVSHCYDVLGCTEATDKYGFVQLILANEPLGQDVVESHAYCNSCNDDVDTDPPFLGYQFKRED